jgi:hypothetical protein
MNKYLDAEDQYTREVYKDLMTIILYTPVCCLMIIEGHWLAASIWTLAISILSYAILVQKRKRYKLWRELDLVRRRINYNASRIRLLNAEEYKGGLGKHD